METAIAAGAPRLPGDPVHSKLGEDASEKSQRAVNEKTELALTESLRQDIDREGSTSPDDNVVDFDGPNDPTKPVNWPKKKKWIMVACLSAMCLITPLASSMFAPGIPEVLEDFHSTSSILGGFCVSIYVLGYAAGPALLAPLSEMYGRAIVYHVTNILFIIFTIACAVSSNLSMLIVFRFFAGFAGSCCITIFGGTLADLFVQEERGAALSIASMGPLLGPTIGPVTGGFIAETIGWRWVFWILTIAAGIVTVLYFVFMGETYASILLQQKAKMLRKKTGNTKLRAKGDVGEGTAQLLGRAIGRPLKLLVLSPIVFLLSLYSAIVYGYLYLFFTTFPSVFEDIYGFGRGVVGLSYIGIGVGMVVGLVVVGAASDKLLKKKAAGGEMKPEYRLPFMVPGAFAIPAGMFIYGWCAQYGVHWIAPIAGTSLVGFGLISIFMSSIQYLVDAFTLHAASAIAAHTIFRSLVGAFLPLAGPALYARLGLGWGNSLLGFIAVAMIFVPFAFMRFGESIRKNPKFQVKL